MGPVSDGLSAATSTSGCSTSEGEAAHRSLEHIQGNVLEELAGPKGIPSVAGESLRGRAIPSWMQKKKKASHMLPAREIRTVSCICKCRFKMYQILRVFFFLFLFARYATALNTLPCHLIPSLSQPYSWERLQVSNPISGAVVGSH